jgi:hypothetical protein
MGLGLFWNRHSRSYIERTGDGEVVERLLVVSDQL